MSPKGEVGVSEDNREGGSSVREQHVQRCDTRECSFLLHPRWLSVARTHAQEEVGKAAAGEDMNSLGVNRSCKDVNANGLPSYDHRVPSVAGEKDNTKGCSKQRFLVFLGGQVLSISL